ncbi:MAG: DUF4129 domain-containing protein, partial [Balneolaceae bacterium]|nr:DUF4129 domain-containing protein [Balneolaceae bacterium]
CYLYRKSLKNLSEAGLITWKKDKTNRSYIYELSSEKLRSVFRDVTTYYEYAEYGHFPVDRERFKTVHDQFQYLNNLIQSAGE